MGVIRLAGLLVGGVGLVGDIVIGIVRAIYGPTADEKWGPTA